MPDSLLSAVETTVPISEGKSADALYAAVVDHDLVVVPDATAASRSIN